MQDSTLSLKILPSLKNDWKIFITNVQKDLEQMLSKYSSEKQRIKDLGRVINKINEINSVSKDNIENILNYKELFMYVDKDLESSFDALNFFKKKNDFDNAAIKPIYTRIINSPRIMELTSEYHSLSIKVQFDKDRIKKLQGLIDENKIDYNLIIELVKKYHFDDTTKKNILFYPVVMLSVKQKEIDDDKEKSVLHIKSFKDLCHDYYQTKTKYQKELINCYYVREGLNDNELDTYGVFINDLNKVLENDFDKETIFKIYAVSLLKIKKDIEELIEGISDISEEIDINEDIEFLEELINKFRFVGNKLMELDYFNENNKKENIFLALDAFNRVILRDDVLLNCDKSIINDFKDQNDYMIGVSDLEKDLGRCISVLTTSKNKIAYIKIGNNVLIIDGVSIDSDKLENVVRTTIIRNLIPIKKQIDLIINNDVDYIELENKITNNLFKEDFYKERKVI